MALIKCTECGHEVSDRASACPNCGCPIEKINYCVECGQPIPEGVNVCPNCGCPTQDNHTHHIESPKKSKSGLIWLISILALSVLLGGGYYLFDKANGAAREKVDKVNIDSLLADGHYTFKGNWESSRHSAQPCKVEFEKKGGKLENCAYTNLKFNTRIPLSGTIQNDTLHFVGDISGKQLVINLKITSDGNMLVGEGIDYAHSGDKAKLNLTKNVTDNKGKQTEETSKEEMGEQKTTHKSERDIIMERGWEFIYNRLKSPSTANLVGYVGPNEDVSVKFANAIDLPGLSLATYQVDAQNSFGAMIRQVFVVFFKNGKPMHMEDANSLKGDVSLLRVTLEINGYDEI